MRELRGMFEKLTQNAKVLSGTAIPSMQFQWGNEEVEQL